MLLSQHQIYSNVASRPVPSAPRKSRAAASSKQGQNRVVYQPKGLAQVPVMTHAEVSRTQSECHCLGTHANLCRTLVEI